jgi:tetratricopeptide (TPR) repeat protein
MTKNAIEAPLVSRLVTEFLRWQPNFKTRVYWRQCSWAISASLLSLILCCPLLAEDALAAPSERPSAAGDNGETVAADDASDTGISREEMEEFANRFAAAAMISVEELNARFDWNAFVDRTLKGLSLAPETAAEFRKGFIDAVPIAKEIFGLAQESGGYRFLRAVKKGHSDRLLFRAIGPAGLNYHLLVLNKDENNELKVVDIGFYTIGELSSQTVRRTLVPVQQSWLGGLLNPGQDRKTIEQLNAMTSAVKQQRRQDALDIYRKLPKKMQHDRFALVMRCQAAQGFDNDQYISGIEAFRAAFPKDPAVLMFSIDYFFAKKEFAAAHQTLNDLNKLVAGDPYLDALHANLWLTEGKLDQARESAQLAISAEPDLLPAYFAAVAVSLKQQNYAETRGLLERMETELGIEFNDLKGQELYSGFVASPEYSVWIDGREQRAAATPPASDP